MNFCVERQLPNNKQLHSILRNAKSASEIKVLRAAYFAAKRWPTSTEITIGFVENPPSDIRIVDYKKAASTLPIDPLQTEIMNDATFDASKIKAFIERIVAERIQPIVGLKLTFVPDVSKAKIRIAFDTKAGAYSYIGIDNLSVSTPETMNLGWFDVPTTMHEFGHALGMIHEHQNPDTNPIKWDKAAVYEWAARTQGWTAEQADTQIINAYYASDIIGSKFDPNSIMLYFFPASLTLNGVGTHQNLRLSADDVIWLSKSYPNGQMKPEEFYLKIYGVPLNVDTTTATPTTTALPTTTAVPTTTALPTTATPSTTTTATPSTATPTTPSETTTNIINKIAMAVMLLSFVAMLLITIFM